ncbi:threonine-phosphate decarboxylase CobD [Propionivibrio limicola]|uniref:threonine-phosphate decarboxylase CobD n=1 Tax=Propionivibrio limicola TaxID=167645 RepID=UPI001291C1DE|nr:threonine-phosphate decarboxylase CobD [Propionivibrio limicola]
MLEHGGRLRLAAQQFGIPLADWLDLSTGINPHTYPVPPIDPLCWQRLPEDNDGLEAAAAAYYGNDRLLVLPGSQAAIQTLPFLFKTAAVTCVSPVYEEHPHAWEKAGHKLRRLPSLQRALSAMTPYVQLCSPNNPTATPYQRASLLDAAAQLHKRGGWLIVDEAFADAEPENTVVSLAGSEAAPNLIVLRSLGKFFGLAGARVGFVFGDAEKLGRLREILGPWPVANPCRLVARAALEDFGWQAAMRTRLRADSQRLAVMLAPLGKVSRTDLFCTVSGTAEPLAVEAVFDHFARRAILTRRFDQHGLIRFGLPGSEPEWERLAQAVQAWSSAC